MSKEIGKQAKILKALADETRLRIILFLAKGERCACEVVPFTGKAQPTVSQHLKILTEAGVLEARREGTNIHYRIKDARVLEMLRKLGLKARGKRSEQRC